MSEKSSLHEAGHAALEGLLHESLRIEEASDEAFVASVMAPLDRGSRSADRKIVVYKFAAGLAAACITIATAVFFLLPDKASQIAVLEDPMGEVLLFRDGEILKLAAGDTLEAGDRLRCTVSATVRYADGSKLELTAAECILGIGAGDQKEVELSSGIAYCSIWPQPERAPLLFETPHGTGEVLGTIFQVRIEEDTTRLQTVHGKVRVRNSEEPWISVDEGYFVSMKPTGSLVAESMDADHFGPGDIVWSQEFGEEYGGDADLEGEQIELTENGHSIHVMRSRYATDIEPDWPPEEWISIEFQSRKALFPTSEDMEIVLRLRSEKAGQLWVTLIPENPTFKGEYMISQEHTLTTEWSEFVMKLSEFESFKKSREATAGLPMRAISVWGLGSGEVLLDRVIVRRSLPDRL